MVQEKDRTTKETETKTREVEDTTPTTPDDTGKADEKADDKG